MYLYLDVTSMKDRPTMQQLSEVMRIEHIEIATVWYELGLELMDSNKILKVIETDHRNDVNTCCRIMFDKWLEKTSDASWSQLVAALDTINMKAAADAVRKLFKSGSEYTQYVHSNYVTNCIYVVKLMHELCINVYQYPMQNGLAVKKN